MFFVFLEDLNRLRGRMLDQLQDIRCIDNDGDFSNNEDSNRSNSSINTEYLTGLLLEFESLIISTVVSLNQQHRGLKVSWEKSLNIDTGDSLKILEFDNSKIDKGSNESIRREIDQLLRLVDWFSEYKLILKGSIKERNEQINSQIDVKRDRGIELHMVNYSDLEESKLTTNDDDRQKRSWIFEDKGTTTKEKLLNKTKRVTTNLIRGNQILQSSILQSDLNLDELKQQTNSLQKMNDKYSQFETVFNKTSQLVKTLEKASRREKRDVYFAIGFLCVCISWVLWRRIFKLPVKLALWLLFNFFKTILLNIGLIKRVSMSSKQVIGSLSSTDATSKVMSSVSSAILSTISYMSTDTQSTFAAVERAVDEAMQRIMDHDEL